MIRELLPELHRACATFRFDIALVTNEHHMFVALQAERKMAAQFTWSALSEHNRAVATKLASFAFREQLVLFIGAGSSLSCGLPSWGGLLRLLAERAPRPLAACQLDEILAIPDPLAQGQALLGFYGSEEEFKRETARLCTPNAFSLQHALLSALPIKEAITTNYDDCFEQAIIGGARHVAALPYASPEHADLWILKMHGCISHPDDIVLTRNDYDTYADRRAALAGIVQASLITKHLLFVGFGLRDPNFEQIIATVKKSTAHYPSCRRELGTSIQLEANAALAEHYAEDLALAWMSTKRPSLAKSARLADIFLDFLASETCKSTRFLNSPMYRSLLSPQELVLQEKIKALLGDLPPEVKKTEAYDVLEKAMIKSFGEYDFRSLQRQFIHSRLLDYQKYKPGRHL